MVFLNTSINANDVIGQVSQKVKDHHLLHKPTKNNLNIEKDNNKGLNPHFNQTYIKRIHMNLPQHQNKDKDLHIL